MMVTCSSDFRKVQCTIYIYVLSWLVLCDLYLCSICNLLYADVITNMEKKLNKLLQHRTYLNLTRRYGFSLCSWLFLFIYHGHFWAWINGVIRQKEWAWFVLLSPLSNLMVNLVPQSRGISFIGYHLQGWHYKGNLDFGCVAPPLDTIYITPLCSL